MWNRFSCASLCYMLATEYLWMSFCGCITIGGLLSTCMPMFHSHLEITALLHTDIIIYELFNTKMTWFLKTLFAQSFHHFNCILCKLLYNYITLQAVKSHRIAWLWYRNTIPLLNHLCFNLRFAAWYNWAVASMSAK